MFEQIKESIKAFEETHGVEAKVDIRVHRLTKEKAEEIAIKLFLATENLQLPQMEGKDGAKWIAINPRENNSLKVTLFYEDRVGEYAKEGI